MERTIKVLVTRDQKPYIFTTFAETLGEIKDYLVEQGATILDDDVFMEARSQANFTASSVNAPLPSNIPWHGETTNDLVFRVVAAQRKIDSGADRTLVVTSIKELGLEQAVKDTYGRNWTQVSTDDLETILQTHYDQEAQRILSDEDDCCCDSYHDDDEIDNLLARLRDAIDALQEAYWALDEKFDHREAIQSISPEEIEKQRQINDINSEFNL